MTQKKQPITQKQIKSVYNEMQKAEEIKKVLNTLLDFGRKHNFYADVDEYVKAKRCVLDYISHLRNYRKSLIQNIYIEL